jgi:hypothetical protein
MLRRIFGVAATLALPALLVAQTPKTPTAGAVHGKALHVQGDVVRPGADVITAGDVAHNDADGNKAEDQKDANEGPDVDEGTTGDTGPDVEVKEGHDVQEGPDAAEQAKGQGGEGDSQDAKPQPPTSARQSQIGRHKP